GVRRIRVRHPRRGPAVLLGQEFPRQTGGGSGRHGGGLPGRYLRHPPADHESSGVIADVTARQGALRASPGGLPAELRRQITGPNQNENGCLPCCAPAGTSVPPEVTWRSTWAPLTAWT